MGLLKLLSFEFSKLLLVSFVRCNIRLFVKKSLNMKDHHKTRPQYSVLFFIKSFGIILVCKLTQQLLSVLLVFIICVAEGVIEFVGIKEELINNSSFLLNLSV